MSVLRRVSPSFRNASQSFFWVLGLLLVSSCASPPQAAFLTPAEAVRRAAAAPAGITGVFRLESKSFRLGEGRERGAVYLFSTADYRFSDCLTIFLSARAVSALQAAGEEAPFAFSGRLIEVSGTAKLVHARASNTAWDEDVLYDRTQVNVEAANQIRIIASK